MAKCEYKYYPWLVEFCNHIAIEEADRDGKKKCIFHSWREDKNVEKFYEEFKKLYESGKHDFRGFVFPKSFDFKRLRNDSKSTNGLEFENANFSHARFLCDVDLSDAKFYGNCGTDFSRAKFLGNMGTDFGEAIFSGKGMINFVGTEFFGDEGTSFRYAKFSGEGGTIFSGAKFNKGRFHCCPDVTPYNTGSLCDGAGGLPYRQGRGDALEDIEDSDNDWTIFNYAEFSGKGEVKFEGKTFYNENKAKFFGVSFERPDKVTFDGVDLNRCRFLGTDISYIKFKEVFWVNQTYTEKDLFEEVAVNDDFNQSSPSNSWDVKNILEKFVTSLKNIFKRIEIYDEEFLRGKVKDAGNHYHVQQLYNQLRLNYERSGRYHEAGDFFVGAMEMRRKGTREKWIIRKALTLYKWISLYGERPVRALLWLIGFWLLFGLIYSLIIGINYNGKDDVGFLFNTYNGIMISLDLLTLGKVKPIYDLLKSPLAPFIRGVQTIISATILSLFILAMNRKFRRTKD